MLCIDNDRIDTRFESIHNFNEGPTFAAVIDVAVKYPQIASDADSMAHFLLKGSLEHHRIIIDDVKTSHIQARAILQTMSTARDFQVPAFRRLK